MYYLRKLHADSDGFLCGISYSTKENIPNRDAWIYVELDPSQHIKYDPNSVEMANIIKSVMDGVNAIINEGETYEF